MCPYQFISLNNLEKSFSGNTEGAMYMYGEKLKTEEGNDDANLPRKPWGD